MKAIGKRLLRLEERLSPGEPPHLIFFCSSLYEGRIDTKRCRKVLDECRFLPTTPGIHVVDLLDLPDGLKEEEIDRWLRVHGEETCNRSDRSVTR